MRPFVLALAAMACTALSCAAASPALTWGDKLEADREVLDDHGAGRFSPSVIDWNGDGKKDLVIGSHSGTPGNARLYLNIGTNSEPKFGKEIFLEAGGQPIKLAAG